MNLLKKTNLFTAFMLLLFSGSLFAQNEPYKRTFSSYAGYFSKEYGITCKMPEEFTDLNQYFVVRMIREDTVNIGAGYFIGPTLKARDKDCMVGYPAEPRYMPKKEIGLRYGNDADIPRLWHKSNADIARSAIILEVKAGLGFPFELSPPPSKDTVKRIVPILYDTTQIDFDKYVTVITGKKAREMFNADSVFLYDILLQKPYEGEYPYCMGMVLNKNNRATLLFKFFFTPKGKKKGEEYINLLSRQVWYDEDFIAK